MTNAYDAQSQALENDIPVMRRSAGGIKNAWKHAYLEAVRAGVVILVDVRTRQMVVPAR